MRIEAPHRVLVALSGGVDSSVCVHLLRKQGCDVSAVVLDLSPAHAPTVAAARETAELLGVPLTVVREHALFEQSVVEPFCREYRAGRTPNPCILCNPAVKFRLLLRTADELGVTHIATGHYAAVRAEQDARGDVRFLLGRAAFLPRDQSYMLYRLGQDVLSRLLLPLHALAKDEVRRIAAAAGLPCAARPDSQENCFIPDNDYPAFIEARCGTLAAGDFIAPDGTPCGKHRGILHYTVGQRKGLGVALGRPVFVRRIDAAENRVYLADAGQEYAAAVTLTDCALQRHPLLDGLSADGGRMDAPAAGGVAPRSVASCSPAPDALASGSPAPDALASGSPALDALASGDPAPDALASGSPAPDALASSDPAPDTLASCSPAPDALASCNPAPDALASGGACAGGGLRCTVKIRSMAQPVPATVTLLASGDAHVLFAEPQRAPAPGQSLVWYAGDDVLGGGFIAEVFPAVSR